MSTQNILLRLIALFAGLAFLLMGNGLQGTLLSIRADIEGFNTLITGLILSSYFAGSIAGALIIPHYIQSIGHIRVFATAASAVSAFAVLHFISIHEWSWLLFRFLTGFCLAGLYIVVESWINAITPNENRGKIFSIYMVINLGSIAVGQQFMNAAPASAPDLFIISSVLFSLAVIPVGLTKQTAPYVPPTKRMSPAKLYGFAPVGVVGLFAAGMCGGAFWTMGPIFARELGMSMAQIASFLSLVIIGGMCLQTPLGALSDKFDRRYTIALNSICLAGMSALLYLFANTDNTLIFYGLSFMFGGFLLTLNALSASHINDRVSSDDMVQANSTIFLIASAGSVAGPIIVSWLMDVLSEQALMIYIAAVQLLYFPFVLFRIFQKSAPKHRDDFHPLSFRGDASVLDPRFDNDSEKQD